ncbi:MAG: Tim44/TimA family putative adaptor protein [Alphaproteobacteria bacterium]|nr:Tim44/TimA family putative adaptor protein [Alphaproteobacteria bacterium]
MGDGFAFLDIVIFAMLAGYLVFQLRRVLGRRTGQEEQRRTNPFKRQPGDAAENDNVIALADRAANESPADEAANLDPEMNGLTQLKIVDPDFDDREFLRGAKGAFEWIVAAFLRGDRKELGNLLSPSLFQSFEAAIDQRESANETLETTISSMKSATIDDVTLEGSLVSITVEFVTDQVKVTRNAQGDVVEGDPNRIDTLTDIWIFARDLRSRDPNWQLVGTRDPEEKA